MDFFKRKGKNASMIPPVAPPPGPAPAAVSNEGARQQLFSRSNDSQSTLRANAGDPYAPALDRAPTYRTTDDNPYGGSKANNDRNELLGGFQPKEEVPKDRKYGYEGREMEDDFDEEEELEGIKQEMRGLKQESVSSSRNALRIAREAEDTARGTLSRLGDQSERIANTERYLDIAKANNQRAEDKAKELKKLNQSIFKPAVTWNKEAKLNAQQEKQLERHLREREDREKARADVQDTHRRLNGAASGPQRESGPQVGAMAARKQARSRYQFEATESDDEIEDEIDENLNETLEVTRTLKRLAMAAGEEIDTHNKRLTGINSKTGDLDLAIIKNTEFLKRAGGKR